MPMWPSACAAFTISTGEDAPRRKLKCVAAASSA
jgi:hypothetical protein